MMTEQQMSEMIIRNGKDIASLQESAKTLSKRIDDNDKVTEGIHKIASNVESLTLQVKLLTESVGNSISKLEAMQKEHDSRLDSLEKEPADKWKTLVSQVIAIVVAAVVGGAVSNILG